ncbi:hypothetical protein JCM6882_007650 [Rhodosporidiobolus microsporus]
MPPCRKTAKTFSGRIPLEVVHLIVDELDALLEKVPDRRKAGKNVALVCRGWRSLGYGLVWSKRVVVLRPKKDILAGVLKHLKSSPTAAESVRELTIDGPGHKSLWPSEEALEELFTLCHNLVRLTVDAAAPRAIKLLETVLQAGNSRLTHLTLRTCGFHQDPFPPADLLRLVLSFPRLVSLPGVINLASSSNVAHPQRPENAPTLSLARLSLSVGSEQFQPGNSELHQAFWRGFTASLDAKALQHLDNGLFHRDLSLLSFLPTCTNLTTLHLTTLESGKFLVPDLTPVLTKFTTLRDFQLLFNKTSLGVVAPVLRAAFLNSLPASVETYDCNVALRVGAEPLEGFLEERKALALRKVKVAVYRRDEKGEVVIANREKAFDYVLLERAGKEDAGGEDEVEAEKEWKVVETRQWW